MAPGVPRQLALLWPRLVSAVAPAGVRSTERVGDGRLLYSPFGLPLSGSQAEQFATRAHDECARASSHRRRRGVADRRMRVDACSRGELFIGSNAEKKIGVVYASCKSHWAPW